MIGCLPTQALAFLAVFVYATHATPAIAFEWKPGFNRVRRASVLLPCRIPRTQPPSSLHNDTESAYRSGSQWKNDNFDDLLRVQTAEPSAYCELSGSHFCRFLSSARRSR